ncbi:cyclodehydratase [Nocardioides maradonensis]
MALTLGQLPTLRAGRPILRRDDHTLQIGIGAHPVLLRDEPAVGALLQHLDPITTPTQRVDLDHPAVRDALARLAAAGHLTGAEPERPLPALGLHVLDPALDDRVAPLLEVAGLRRDDADAEAWLVAAPGPVPRDVADGLLRSGTPHLLVSLLEGAWRIGPFVVPGATACLCCVDAHESEADPRRALLLTQAARAAQRHPEQPDPLLELGALSWALRDLRTYLTGGEPGTWSATVDLPAPDEPYGAPRITRWLRHPECGCAWDQLPFD